jgi:hypothetical protein
MTSAKIPVPVLFVSFFCSLLFCSALGSLTEALLYNRGGFSVPAANILEPEQLIFSFKTNASTVPVHDV